MLWTSQAAAATYRWNVDADGSWTDPANWTLVSGTPNGFGYPNGVDDTAELTDVITADRSVTIPDATTITIGGLLIDDDNRYSIGSDDGLLVFDDGSTTCPLTVSNVNGNGAHSIAVRVRLDAHLEVTSTSSGMLTFARAISQSGGAQNLSVTAGSGAVRFAPDTSSFYTGITTVHAGTLELSGVSGAESIAGQLNIGGGAQTATVTLLASHQMAAGTFVAVNANGVLNLNDQFEDGVNLFAVTDGAVTIGTGRLTTSGLLTLDGATFTATGVGQLVLGGNVTVAGSPDSTISGGTLDLGSAGTRTITANGHLAVSSVIAGSATLAKAGGGQLRTSGVNTFSGTTSITGGGFHVTGSHASSAVSLAGGFLTGTGVVGSITSTGALAGISAGGISGQTPLRSGSISLSGNVEFSVNLTGVNEGDWQKLAVTGTVTLNSADLFSTRTFTPAPTMLFTIIDNDGVDPIVGTFGTHAEGDTLIISSMPFVITYAGGDGNDVVLYRRDDPPTIINLADTMNINEDSGPHDMTMTIGDEITPVADLVLTAQSSNPAVIANTGVTFIGTAPLRTLRFTPVANAHGQATVTIRVTDESGKFVEETIDFTVNPINDEPTMMTIGPRTIDEDGVLGVAFTVDDIDDDETDIIVTATSSNQFFVPNGSIVIGGTGANRTLTAMPLLNQHGQVTIIVNATDGELTVQQGITLTVTAVNDAPVIDGIGPQVIDEDGQAGPVFTIHDVDDFLDAVIVTATSSNQQLVTDASLVVDDPTGGIKTLWVRPVANATGTATITVHATDGDDDAVPRTFLVTVNPVNDAPSISAIGPRTIDEDTALAPVVFTVTDVDNDATTTTVSAASSNQALVPNANLTVVACPACGADAWTIAATPVANAFGTTTITVTANDGGAQASTAFVLTVNAVADPGDTITYVLAEGATGGFFDTDLLIANPNNAPAPITLTFLKQDGTTVVVTRTVAAQRHLTIHVDDLPNLADASAATTVRSDAGLPLAVERTMFWNDARYGGHTDAAVAGPSRSWVFGEGAQGFFDTYLLIANPNTEAADLTLTFLREGEPPFVATRAVGGLSRLTIHAGEFPELQNRSFGIAVASTQPVNAERATYFGTTAARLWSGGQASAGVAQPALNWFLAEGATGTFFDTFILLGNPGNTPANVGVQFLLDTGEAVNVTRQVPAHGRVTIPVDMEPDPRVQSASLSTVVTSDVPIVAERSMYWPTGEALPWGEAHHAVGLTGTATRWALAEGRVGGAFGYVTYILLANPSSTTATVRISFLRENGPPIVHTYDVAPTSRRTVDVGSDFPALRDQLFGASIEVINGVGIAVERAMYWTSNGIFLAGGTGATATRLP